MSLRAVFQQISPSQNNRSYHLPNSTKIYNPKEQAGFIKEPSDAFLSYIPALIIYYTV